MAFAADGDLTTWWEPFTVNSMLVKRPGRFWPQNIATDGSLESYIELYKLIGYQICSGDSRELLYEKIALFGYQDKYEAEMLTARIAFSGFF